MMGAISIRIALIKASPKGCIRAPSSGRSLPSRIPAAMAMRTWSHSCLYQACVLALMSFSLEATGGYYTRLLRLRDREKQTQNGGLRPKILCDIVPALADCNGCVRRVTC